MSRTVRTVSQLCLIAIGVMVYGSALCQLSSNVTYFVQPSCTGPDARKPAQEDQFYFRLEITDLNSDSHLEIAVNGEALTQFNVTSADLPYVREVGPFRHSGAGGSYHEYILRSLDTEIADTLYLAEVVCGFSTDNGLNRPGYYCVGLDASVVAQATPEGLASPALPEKMYTYVLINRVTQHVEAKNFSGHFRGVSDLSDYEVHAFATFFEESADFINSISLGEALQQGDLLVCHAFCGVFELETDCTSFDLSLKKDVRDGTVYGFGDTVTFEITVFNEGLIPAYNVEVVDNLPDGLLFEPALNPNWTAELVSLPIAKIEVGQSVVIPIRLIVDAASGLIDIVNVAEIVSGTSDPERTIPAFDIDSNPDNQDEMEDDQDEAEITIIENLCNSTFFVDVQKDPSCPGENVVMTPQVMMANEPVIFRWRYNGRVISREQVLSLSPEEVDPNGSYQLTAIDNMGCTSVMDIPVDMIDNENRFGCYSDLNVGIDEDCKMRIRPGMFTGRDVSGLKDYIVEIRDPAGNIVDQQDLSSYPIGVVFEAKIINPCNDATICWTRLHIENKEIPTYSFYNNKVHEMYCSGEINTPTALIIDYNRERDIPILSALQFQDSLNKTICVQDWKVDVADQFLSTVDMCSDVEVIRVYSIFDQERSVPLDTAYLTVRRLSIDAIVAPSDIDNIGCGEEVHPTTLSSFPYAVLHGDTTFLLPAVDGNYNEPMCGIGLKYQDRYIGEGCVWGAKKIERTWAIADWCGGEPVYQKQYLYIIDREAPVMTSTADTIRIVAKPYNCFANVRPSDYVVVSDNCISVPTITVGGQLEELPLGLSVRRVEAQDECGNDVGLDIVFVVTEASPPVPILNEYMTLSFTTDTVSTDHYILASSFDAGSHDSDCGPVSVSIARWSEVDIIERSGGQVHTSTTLYNCNPTSDLDDNEDGQVSISEVFRDRVEVCCQDIGTTIKVIVLITDASGNEARAEAYLDVVTKMTWTACDDGDDCTIGDRNYGDCGCQGAPETRDTDRDGEIDCQDDEIQLCLDGEVVIVLYEDLDSLLALGAVGGNCDTEMAMIAGDVSTPQGAMIQGVNIIVNTVQGKTTNEEGVYELRDQEMYRRYEIEPLKDDDHLNGVTARDLIILQEYLIGLQSLDDPYLRIAADVNHDGKISALDIVDMQRLLLGQRDDWRNNRSWRFIIKDYQWDDITRPWDYQELNVISSLTKDLMDEDWIGVKTGDLTGDAQTSINTSQNRSNTSWDLTIEDREVTKGQVISIEVTGDAFSQTLKGLQLSFSTEDIIIRSMVSGDCDISSDQFFLGDVHDNMMRLLWTGKTNISKQALFSLEIEAQVDGRLSDLLALDKDKLQLAIFDGGIDAEVKLKYGELVTTQVSKVLAKMYQNQPNPFTGQTVIQFEIPTDGNVTFDFYSASGSLLLHMDNEYGAGNNAISLSHQDLQFYSGAIYYQMTYQDQKYTRTMVITK